MPAHLFSQDELFASSALLGQIMLFGWEALLVPSSGQYAVLTTNDDRHIVVAPSELALEATAQTLHESEWSTTRHGPRDSGGAR
jgi:hypothetical protein